MLWPRKKNSDAHFDSPSMLLVSEDVYLRPAESGDYEAWAEIRHRNERHLKPFEPLWPKDCLTEEFFQRRLRRINADWASDSAYCFLIFEQDNQSLIGGININNVCRGAAQYASLGYWIDEAHQGRGLMKQAVLTTLDFAFGPLKLARMNAACVPHNLRSKNLLLSAGFTEEGFAKAYIQINGERKDHILFGLNAEDFSGVSCNP